VDWSASGYTICLQRGSLYSRDQRIIPILLEHEVHMTRPVRVSVECFEQLPHRPVIRDRIRHRQDRFEPEVPSLITGQDSSAIRTSPVSMLDVVEAFRVRLPDVDACVGDWIPFYIFERAKDQQGLAVCVLRDQAAVRGVLCFVRVKRSEDRAFGAVRWFGVVD
jgi:hypothetical protein